MQSLEEGRSIRQWGTDRNPGSRLVEERTCVGQPAHWCSGIAGRKEVCKVGRHPVG